MARKTLQDEEIIAALIAQGSIKGAAASLGCAERTLYDRIKTATAKLQGQVCGAIDTLTEIMKDEDTAKQTRVNSAVAILQNAARFTETIDIVERLEAIEEAQEQARDI